MMLSDDKISHMTHVLLNGLMKRNLLSAIEEESKIRTEIKRTIVAELKIGEEIDMVVRRKLQSFSRKIVEGSPEWEIMYKKFYREEEIKKGRAS
jgi:uncharacterized protein